MRELVLYKEGEASMVRWIKRRIKSNLNFFAGTYGATGSGKSWTDLSIAYMIDPEFEPRQIVFEFEDFMEVLEADWFNKKKWKIIIFEEVQTSFSNRKWQQEDNQLFNEVISTFRHLNVILLINSVYSDFLDSQSMKMIHVNFDVIGHNPKTQLTHVRPKILQYNAQQKKYYYKFLKVLHKGSKGVSPLQDWFVKKPPQHLINSYEKAKTKFTSKLNQRVKMRLKKRRELEELKNSTNKTTEERKPLTDIQRKVMETLGNITESNKLQRASEILGVSTTAIHKNQKSAEKKGFFIKEFEGSDEND